MTLSILPYEQVGSYNIRLALMSDLPALVAIESQCFSSDKISIRQLKYWLKHRSRVFLVIEIREKIVGYGLAIMRKGTRLARLYSIAIDEEVRGSGAAKKLLEKLEQGVLSAGKLFMRLEVANYNTRAIAFYHKCGYSIFGLFRDYYEDHTDALRLQKAIGHHDSIQRLPAFPWYQQTTDFTCGPAALMMAMAKLSESIPLSQSLEFDVWREATTIFMTSGHGGCHPIGLALAANTRGFDVEVYLNQDVPIFVNSVRKHDKKKILQMIEQQFMSEANARNISIQVKEWSFDLLKQFIREGAVVLCLISTYSMDGYKAPHWITITEVDEAFFYFHDPCGSAESLDSQHIPMAIDDYIKVSSYGKQRLRAAVVVRQNKSDVSERC
jgi:ribosomal protein S18 acetylase RimI-like enzyme